MTKKQEHICTLPAGEGCYWRVEARCILSDHYCEYRQLKKQEQLYICPKAKECRPVGHCDGKEPHERYSGCGKWYCPITGKAVSCIPVEPEKHIIQEGSRQHVISYDSQGRHCSEPNCEINFESEPQPATCPDCGHKAHPDSLCYHTNDAGSFDCKCDLQPEKQAKPFERYDKYWVMKLADIDKYLTQTQKDSLADIIHIIQDGRGKDGKIPCNSYVVVKEGLPYTEQVWQLIEDYETKPNKKPEQPTQMPLREQKIDKKLCRIICQCGDLNQPKYCTEQKKRCNKYYRIIAWYKAQQQARDQQVAAQAVKEFAEKVIMGMPLDIIYPEVTCPNCDKPTEWQEGYKTGANSMKAAIIKGIRAMAGKE